MGYLDIVKLLLDQIETEQLRNFEDRFGLREVLCEAISNHCVNNDMDLIKQLIQLNPYLPHDINYHGCSVLGLAIRANHLEIVKLLLDAGMDVNKNYGRTNLYKNNPALHTAAYNGYTDIVLSLLNTPDLKLNVHKTNKQGNTALHLAAERGHTQVISILLNAGLDVNQTNNNGKNALHFAIEQDHINSVAILLNAAGVDINSQTIYGFTPLHYAALKGNEKIISILLEAGADVNLVNYKSQRAIDVTDNPSCKKILNEFQENLIKNQPNQLFDAIKKDDVDSVNKYCNEQTIGIKHDKIKMHPIQYAIHLNHVDCLKILLEKTLEQGKDINQFTINGNNILHLAVSQGCVEVVSFLLNHPHINLDIDQKNNDGNTVLHLAAKNGHGTCALMILNRNARYDLLNNDSKTPYGIAHPVCKDMIPATELQRKSQEEEGFIESISNSFFSIFNPKPPMEVKGALNELHNKL